MQPTQATPQRRDKLPDSGQPLPDAAKEARRQAMKVKSPQQRMNDELRRQRLEAAHRARDAETARMVELGKQRALDKAEKEYRALMQNVEEGQAMMNVTRQQLAEMDRAADVKKEDMYRQWNDDVFMPIQNQIYEVVNNTDDRELSRQRRQKMDEYMHATQATYGVFLASTTGQPGHIHKKLVVGKLRDPLKRLLVS
jgi:hypothetical protein